MSPITFSFLALVCSTFGKTSESHHGRDVISGDISMAHLFNPITLYTDKLRQPREMRHYNTNSRSKRETDNDQRCKPFTYKPGMKRLTHPRDPEDNSKPGESTYTKSTTCFTTIEAPDHSSQVITLTFADVFEIEGHPKCENDYLEIRDGKFGYAVPMYKFCGKEFPPTITSTGPYLWLKFKSDDIIEYNGFTIDIDFPTKANSVSIPDTCYIHVTHQTSAVIDSNSEDVKQCRAETKGSLDIQWKIETAHGTQIFLNITRFQLAAPNNCSANSVQVFGSEPNFDHKLGFFCSSVAQFITTAPETKGTGPGNIIYVRMFSERRQSNFSARFTEFRIADSCKANEFNCLDGTCIDGSLQCDKIDNCRLKTDEDPVDCKGETQSLLKDSSTILIVFSLILSAIIFVLFFKCMRKLYQDQKQINKHRANLCGLMSIDKTSQLTLNSKRARDFSPLSLEYENRANEICRQKIQEKSSSVDSNCLRPPDPEDEWPESVPVLPEDIRIEHKPRPNRGFGLQEEIRRAEVKEENDKNEIRDAPFCVPDLQEAECQTRESLFLMDPIPKPGTNSGSNSHRTSDVGSPAPAPAAEVTLELLRQSTAQDTSAPQMERPMSSETTRSAPDVIIVSPSQFVEARR